MSNNSVETLAELGFMRLLGAGSVLDQGMGLGGCLQSLDASHDVC